MIIWILVTTIVLLIGSIGLVVYYLYRLKRKKTPAKTSEPSKEDTPQPTRKIWGERILLTAPVVATGWLIIYKPNFSDFGVKEIVIAFLLAWSCVVGVFLKFDLKFGSLKPSSWSWEQVIGATLASVGAFIAIEMLFEHVFTVQPNIGEMYGKVSTFVVVFIMTVKVAVSMKLGTIVAEGDFSSVTNALHTALSIVFCWVMLGTILLCGLMGILMIAGGRVPFLHPKVIVVRQPPPVPLYKTLTPPRWEYAQIVIDKDGKPRADKEFEHYDKVEMVNFISPEKFEFKIWLPNRRDWLVFTYDSTTNNPAGIWKQRGHHGTFEGSWETPETFKGVALGDKDVGFFFNHYGGDPLLRAGSLL